MYTIGNALIAQTMLKHDIAAGSNVPARLMIYEDAENRTARLTHDLPSSIMSGSPNEKVIAAAKTWTPNSLHSPLTLPAPKLRRHERAVTSYNHSFRSLITRSVGFEC
jgi:hypothetical protein